METIGIREAKAQLSRLVRNAQRGDTVTLTHRGQPIAKIVPVSELDKTDEARIEELRRRGWIEEQTAAPVSIPRIEVESGLAQRFLRQDRDGR